MCRLVPLVPLVPLPVNSLHTIPYGNDKRNSRVRVRPCLNTWKIPKYEVSSAKVMCTIPAGLKWRLQIFYVRTRSGTSVFHSCYSHTKYFFIFLKKTHNENCPLQPTHAVVWIIIMKCCVWTVCLNVAYQPIFVNGLKCADVRRHEAYVLLLARFPRALSRGKFLFPDECLICRSSQTGMLFFESNKILITRLKWKPTFHTWWYGEFQLKVVILFHISLKELPEVEAFCYTRADQQREYGSGVFSAS